jgi:hypothetical protein
MNRNPARVATALLLAAIACFVLPGRTRADAPPSTQPARQVQTGEVDLTFTERSPLSTQKEIARRLKVTPASLGEDYDLSKLPYKAYIPTNYNPGTPYGLFVYLGYKNTVSSPPPWRPALEESRVIFISPICHSGNQDAPAVPLWQSIGLVLDAVHNCEIRFNIDRHRTYLMSWSDDSLKASFSTADIFTGFIVTCPSGWSTRINMPGGRYSPPSFMPPPIDLMSLAKTRAYFLVADNSPDYITFTTLIAGAMRRDDFAHLTMIPLSLTTDLHYPNLKAEWFEQQALPFLDKASATAETAKPASESPTTTPVVGSSPPVNPAQHLLDMAKLYISNGQTDFAQKKLQQIIDTYPNDPAAEKAKQLLGQMNQ